MPSYVLSTLDQASRTIDAVKRDALKIMFDVFHIAGNGDDPGQAFRTHRANVGHIQIADPSTRAEPEGLGPTVRAFASAGYDAPFGAEYVPSQIGEHRFDWMKSLR